MEDVSDINYIEISCKHWECCGESLGSEEGVLIWSNN